MGYVICRLGRGFRKLLVREFPALWGNAAEARIYPTKGDAHRIRLRLNGERTAILDAKTNLSRPVPDEQD